MPTEQRRLRTSLKALAMAFDRAPLYLAISSLATGELVEVNDTFVTLTGYSREEAIGRNAADLGLWVDPGERAAGLERLRREGRVREQEVRFRHKSGEERTFLLSAELAELGGEVHVLNAAVDVTDRLRAESELRESRARLNFVLEAGRLGFWELDLGTGEARTSFEHDRCFGATAPFPRWDYATFLAFVHPDDRERVDARFQEAVESQGDWHFECRVVWEDGSVHWIDARGSHYRDADGVVRHMLGTVADVTDRKAAEAEREDLLCELAAERGHLQELNDTLEARVRQRTLQVQELAAELTVAEAKERGRLAQLLHDELQQQLFALQYALRAARKVAPDLPEAQARLDEANELLLEAIRISRATTLDLRPPLLDGGLVQALRWLARDTETRHGLRVRLSAPEEVEVASPSLQILVVNLARELLFNVVKHAGVQEARLELRATPEALELTVADEGRGFDPACLQGGSSGTGLGLSGARKRMELFDGTLRVVASPGCGTRVTMKVPTASFTVT